MTSVNSKMSTTQNISFKIQTLLVLKIRPLNINLLQKTKNIRNLKNYNFLIVSKYCNLIIDYKILFRKRNVCALHVKLLQILSLKILCFDKRNNSFTSTKRHNPKVMEVTR